MRNMLSALVAILFLGQVSRAQVPDSVRLFVDSALTLMQKQSSLSSQVNWLQVCDSVGRMTQHARDV